MSDELLTVDELGIMWYPDFEPLESIGDCNHPCKHGSLITVALGPTDRAHELRQCTFCGCRCWFTRTIREVKQPSRPVGRFLLIRRPVPPIQEPRLPSNA